MEYLSTGKPVFSTPALMYADTNLLFVSRNEDVVSDFRTLLDEWTSWSGAAESIKRIQFALQNTYCQQIARIEEHINGQSGNGK
jgi:hypothetical protein